MFELSSLDAVELFRLCAESTENSDAWAEFLRRYTVKMKLFIAGTLRQFGGSTLTNSSMGVCGIQESDLFQNAIVRLVANDCTAMKRFSGKGEAELLAYLAVICRSSVMDALRRAVAVKRTLDRDNPYEADASVNGNGSLIDVGDFDRKVLFREIVSLTSDAMESGSNPTCSRDRLIFNLHFYHGLSFNQIAQCKGVNLSKAGVEKLLKRLISRVKTLATTGKQKETAL